MTLTSRSLMWVVMVQHKSSDQYLTSGKVSTRSIHMFKRHRFLKTLTNNFNILSNADADANTNAVVTAIALPVLQYRRAKLEPSQEIMALFVLCKLILQTPIRSHPVGLDVLFLVGPFVYFHSSCEQTAMALARLRGCAGLPEPSLVAYVISNIISWVGSNIKMTIDHV